VSSDFYTEIEHTVSYKHCLVGTTLWCYCC